MVLDCTGCHGLNLQGTNIAGADPKAELTRLLSTGQSKTGKEVGMSHIARSMFSHLTPREREAIVDYFLACANRPQ